MDNSKRQAPFVNIGSSLLLVVFLALCLITFATLSLSSARSDESFSKRMADHKAEYYQASSQAEDLLAQIDLLLEETDWKALDFGKIDPNIHYEPDNATVSYQVPINEKQTLDVVLALNPLEETAENGNYRIQKWQTVNTGKWEGGDTLELK